MRLHTFLFLSSCFFLGMQAQGFKYLNIGDGLSSNQVFQVEKDSTGFMWFVTYMGINRFDGSQVKQYKIKEDSLVFENYPSYTQMTLGKAGEVLVAFQEGKIFRYNKLIDDYEPVFDMKERANYRGFLLSTIYVDSENRLWIFSNYGLHIYNLTNKNFRSYFLFDDDMPTCVVESGNGTYYVGTNKHIYKLEERRSDNFSVSSKIKIDAPYGKVTYLFHTKNKVYIGTELKGLFILDIKTEHIKSLFPQIPNIVVRSIEYAVENKIVIGTDGSGVYIIDSNTDELISHFDSDADSQNGLSSNSIYDIAVDENNCIWVTTYANGVNIIDPILQNISLFRHVQNEFKSLINSQINALIEDSDGDLWFGTNNGVSCYISRTNEWKHYLYNQDRKAVIISLAEDSLKNIWAGGYGIGAFRIDKKTGKIFNFRKNNEIPRNSIDTDYIYAIYSDKESVWLGGLSGALTRYNISNDTYQYYDIEVISEIKPLNDKTLLLGTSTGFCVFDIKTAYYKQYADFQKNPTSRVVRKFYAVSDTEIWLGTEGSGLVKFDSRTESFRYYTTKDGLPSNYIYSIEGDDDANIWITTERTISYFNRETEQFLNVGEYVGLNDFSFNPYASTKRKNGNLVFGTTEGALEFPANSIPVSDIEASLIFTDFKLFYNSVEIGAEKSPLQYAVNETNSLSLRHNQNSFSFSFSAISYRSQKQIIYEYMLEGFDESWFTIDEGNTISYTNISPGNYTFRLKAINRDTKELIDERSIDINIKPPFWKSGWAYLIYFILFLAVLKLVLQYIKSMMEKRYSKEKIQFFTNMAHDIRTPVTLIKAPLNDLLENENLSEKGITALDIAARNAEKLSLLVTQLMDFQKADMASLRLIVSKHELKNYILEKKVLYKVEAERKNINLTAEISFDSLHVWFDREKMDKIINNLLSNAIKYTNSEGSIRIKVSQDEKNWHLSITDTGIGIPVSEQKYLFKRFFRAHNAINSKETGSGIGLLLTKELVKLHEGTIDFSSKENVGTEFKLTFKKGKDFFQEKETLKAYMIEENEDIAATDIAPDNEKEPEVNDERIKAKILIVEDNDDMRLYLKNNLSEQYTIAEASDGQEALENIEIINPDLVISDNLMPRMNGIDFCMKLKNSMETSHIPVILLTALSDKEDVLKGLDCGADDYIIKPFDITILKAKIRNILQNRETLKKLFAVSEGAEATLEYTNPLDKEFIEKAVRLIEENLDEPSFSTNELSAGMSMSRSSFFNKLKALTGQGPNDFIRTIRLNKAKELLLTKQYNVFETSIMTGFSDAKYFSTAFKKQFGISPSKIGK